MEQKLEKLIVNKESGTYVLANGERIHSSKRLWFKNSTSNLMLEYESSKAIPILHYDLFGKCINKIPEYLKKQFEIIEYIPDMETKELKIEIPEGYEIQK